MLNTPFSPWPSYSNEEISKVSEILRSGRVNYWTGTEGREFEKEFARFCDSQFGVVCANGTVALDLAWMALGLQQGDEVIVTSRSFIASVSSIVMAGGIPVFADVDLDSQNITVDSVASLITSKTRAICCVHLAGWPCDMLALRDLADANELALVEDCAQAHGAKIGGKSVGSFGDISAWSFCQDKIMSTGGEGGMVTTNNEDHWRKIWEFKDHGKSFDSVYKKEHPPGFRWLHDSFGTNWRLPEIQSAIGRIQLKLMPEWHQQRRNNAMQIIEACQGNSAFRTPLPADDVDHAWYRAYVFLCPASLKSAWNRDRVMEEIVSDGVPCFSGSCSEIYNERCFQEAEFEVVHELPNARSLGETSLMFLVHPTLTQDQISKTCEIVKKIAERAVR